MKIPKTLNYEELTNFFAGQYHNQWPEEYGTWENALSDVCRRSSIPWLKLIMNELTTLLAFKLDEATLKVIITKECHANYHAPADGHSYQEWLEKLRSKLAGFIKEATKFKS
ncbi:MAG: hypothetical protein IPN95_31665 [Bacteroidetes bacterium]|nr:hypothetical protein [Bacteroidota bacterium]MBP6720989.1 hypothetical protein [Bacteroidia bacterium]